MRASEPEGAVVLGVDVESFQEFVQTLERMALGNQYVFRGQACDLWELRPGLSRVFRGEPGNPFFRGAALLPQDAWTLTKQHLQCFERHLQNVKERIPFLAKIDLSTIPREELWVLGQHYRLQTPVLDWTESPFIAAYFAFQGQPGKEDHCFDAWKEEPWRCVWAARRCSINRRFSKYQDPTRAFRSIHFFDSKICFPRIRDQRGLFSLGPTLDCVEDVVGVNFKGYRTPVLVQIRIKHTQNFIKSLEKHVTETTVLEASRNEYLEEAASRCNSHLKGVLAAFAGSRL